MSTVDAPVEEKTPSIRAELLKSHEKWIQRQRKKGITISDAKVLATQLLSLMPLTEVVEYCETLKFYVMFDKLKVVMLEKAEAEVKVSEN